MEISVTPDELSHGSLSATHLSQAVEAVKTDGFVILANVIDHGHLDALRERMNADSQTLIKAETWGGAGRIRGHLQQGPPPFAPFVFRDIVANPFAIQVTSAILGAGAYNRFYSGNTNCPGSEIQPLHRDGPALWPNAAVAHPTSSLIINSALMDVDEENGATELWPGTHLETNIDVRVEAKAEASRREIVPPVRAITSKGSLLIRDHRLWHRGVPNSSNVVRHMIALIHNIHWLQRPEKLFFNKGCEAAFPNDDFDHQVEFTSQPLDYLSGRYAVPKTQA